MEQSCLIKRQERANNGDCHDDDYDDDDLNVCDF